jgi:small subunit ribosomal protein S20
VAAHKSAEKRARQAEKRRVHNRTVKSRVNTLVKKAREAVAQDPAGATPSLRDAERALRKAASKGVIPARRASRRVSRLARAAARPR